MSCCEVFGMKKSDLFEAFDLFDVRDFGKVTVLSAVFFLVHSQSCIFIYDDILQQWSNEVFCSVFCSFFFVFILLCIVPF